MGTKTFNIATLSQFNNGDLCHVIGHVGIMDSGVARAVASIDSTFFWSNNNEITASGTWTGHGSASYTITLTSSQLIFNYTATWSSGWSDVNLQVYKVTSPWVAAQKAYKKQNGAWVEIMDMSQVFDANTSYNYGGDAPT